MDISDTSANFSAYVLVKAHFSKLLKHSVDTCAAKLLHVFKTAS
jgi:hypothetical protein